MNTSELAHQRFTYATRQLLEITAKVTTDLENGHTDLHNGLQLLNAVKVLSDLVLGSLHAPDTTTPAIANQVLDLYDEVFAY
jgi:hypothetical protein